MSRRLGELLEQTR